MALQVGNAGFGASMLRTRVPATLMTAFLLLTVGCADPRSIIPLEVRLGPPVLTDGTTPARPLKVAIAPFTDTRNDVTKLGTRTELWGHVISFTSEGQSTGQSVAYALADYAHRRKGWETWIDQPGLGLRNSSPDVQIAGVIKVLNMTADLTFGTDIDVKVMLEVIVRNRLNQTTWSTTVEGRQSTWVFTFDLSDAEAAIRAALREAFDQFLVRSRVEGKTLEQQAERTDQSRAARRPPSVPRSQVSLATQHATENDVPSIRPSSEALAAAGREGRPGSRSHHAVSPQAMAPLESSDGALGLLTIGAVNRDGVAGSPQGSLDQANVSSLCTWSLDPDRPGKLCLT